MKRVQSKSLPNSSYRMWAHQFQYTGHGTQPQQQWNSFSPKQTNESRISIVQCNISSCSMSGLEHGLRSGSKHSSEWKIHSSNSGSLDHGLTISAMPAQCEDLEVAGIVCFVVYKCGPGPSSQKRGQMSRGKHFFFFFYILLPHFSHLEDWFNFALL